MSKREKVYSEHTVLRYVQCHPYDFRVAQCEANGVEEPFVALTAIMNHPYLRFHLIDMFSRKGQLPYCAHDDRKATKFEKFITFDHSGNSFQLWTFRASEPFIRIRPIWRYREDLIPYFRQICPVLPEVLEKAKFPALVPKQEERLARQLVAEKELALGMITTTRVSSHKYVSLVVPPQRGFTPVVPRSRIFRGRMGTPNSIPDFHAKIDETATEFKVSPDITRHFHELLLQAEEKAREREEKLRQQLELYQGKVAVLEVQLTRANKSEAFMKGKLASYEGEMSLLGSGQLITKYEELKRDLENTRAENEKMKAEIEKMKTTFDEERQTEMKKFDDDMDSALKGNDMKHSDKLKSALEENDERHRVELQQALDDAKRISEEKEKKALEQKESQYQATLSEIKKMANEREKELREQIDQLKEKKVILPISETLSSLPSQAKISIEYSQPQPQLAIIQQNSQEQYIESMKPRPNQKKKTFPLSLEVAVGLFSNFCLTRCKEESWTRKEVIRISFNEWLGDNYRKVSQPLFNQIIDSGKVRVRSLDGNSYLGLTLK